MIKNFAAQPNKLKEKIVTIYVMIVLCILNVCQYKKFENHLHPQVKALMYKPAWPIPLHNIQYINLFTC